MTVHKRKGHMRTIKTKTHAIKRTTVKPTTVRRKK